MPPRATLLVRLAELLAATGQGRRCRVAVDGPDAAGKTTLADEVAALMATSRPVVRASVDGFHRPRAVRRRRGAESPTGYYLDAFDHVALRACLLDPWAPDGSGAYRSRVYDLAAEAAVHEPLSTAPEEAVLIVDGVFLLREHLRDAWDLSVFVTADEAEILRRAELRDARLFGSPQAVRRRYHTRYLPAQRRYLAEAAPLHVADVVIDNTGPESPGLLRFPARR